MVDWVAGEVERAEVVLTGWRAEWLVGWKVRWREGWIPGCRVEG